MYPTCVSSKLCEFISTVPVSPVRFFANTIVTDNLENFLCTFVNRTLTDFKGGRKLVDNIDRSGHPAFVADKVFVNLLY